MYKIAKYLTDDERKYAVFDDNGERHVYEPKGNKYPQPRCNGYCPLGFATDHLSGFDGEPDNAEVALRLNQEAAYPFTDVEWAEVEEAASDFIYDWDSGMLSVKYLADAMGVDPETGDIVEQEIPYVQNS